ncbi:MAG TPA: hypothetical protein VEI02_16245, partial [Planctomycetota bacterium]|nr:hypothetical protein [Planctomycetota bacterium]
QARGYEECVRTVNLGFSGSAHLELEMTPIPGEQEPERRMRQGVYYDHEGNRRVYWYEEE